MTSGAGIRIAHGDDDAGQIRGNDHIGTGGSPALICTWLERDVERACGGACPGAF